MLKLLFVISYFLANHLNNQDSDTINNQLFSNLQSNNINSNDITNINLNKYPLNLLPDLDNLINVEIIFMFILFNLFVSNIISNIDFTKYISNDTKFGKLFHFILKRYLKV